MKYLKPTPENLEKCENLDFAREYISPKFLPSPVREEFKELPHKTIMDLDLFYAINFDDGKYSCLGNDFLKTWDITLDELNKIAFDNIREYKFELTGGIRAYDEKVDEHFDLYTLSNPDSIDGCVQMLRTDVLNEIYTQIGEFYILPQTSSFAIIIPKVEKISDEEFIADYKRVLQMQIKNILPNMFLITDRCYGFDAANKVIFPYQNV